MNSRLLNSANDQLTEFDLGFQSITLTSQSGKTATLLSVPTLGPAVGSEFIHIEGTAEPRDYGSAVDENSCRELTGFTLLRRQSMARAALHPRR